VPPIPRAASHKTAVDEAIVGGLHDAWAADCPDTEYHDLVDRLPADAQECLGDADEMRGCLDRPRPRSLRARRRRLARPPPAPRLRSADRGARAKVPSP
jgi:hypothetical protein